MNFSASAENECLHVQNGYLHIGDENRYPSIGSVNEMLSNIDLPGAAPAPSDVNDGPPITFCNTFDLANPPESFAQFVSDLPEASMPHPGELTTELLDALNAPEATEEGYESNDGGGDDNDNDNDNSNGTVTPMDRHPEALLHPELLFTSQSEPSLPVDTSQNMPTSEGTDIFGGNSDFNNFQRAAEYWADFKSLGTYICPARRVTSTSAVDASSSSALGIDAPTSMSVDPTPNTMSCDASSPHTAGLVVAPVGRLGLSSPHLTVPGLSAASHRPTRPTRLSTPALSYGSRSSASASPTPTSDIDQDAMLNTLLAFSSPSTNPNADANAPHHFLHLPPPAKKPLPAPPVEQPLPPSAEGPQRPPPDPTKLPLEFTARPAHGKALFDEHGTLVGWMGDPRTWEQFDLKSVEAAKPVPVQRKKSKGKARKSLLSTIGRAQPVPELQHPSHQLPQFMWNPVGSFEGQPQHQPQGYGFPAQQHMSMQSYVPAMQHLPSQQSYAPSPHPYAQSQPSPSYPPLFQAPHPQLHVIQSAYTDMLGMQHTAAGSSSDQPGTKRKRHTTLGSGMPSVMRPLPPDSGAQIHMFDGRLPSVMRSVSNASEEGDGNGKRAGKRSRNA